MPNAEQRAAEQAALHGGYKARAMELAGLAERRMTTIRELGGELTAACGRIVNLQAELDAAMRRAFAAEDIITALRAEHARQESDHLMVLQERDDARYARASAEAEENALRAECARLRGVMLTQIASLQDALGLNDGRSR